jgi:simple sugar transport system ATP-binding protein
MGPLLEPPSERRSPPIISLVDISKRFGPIWANRHISLELCRGEVHALVGENGAGKSTLAGILFGHHRLDGGQVIIDGKALILRRPRDAIRAGIGLIHQQLLIFPQLTVLENILVGSEPSAWSRPLAAQVELQVQRLCERFGFHLTMNLPARDLSYAQRQHIEILRMLMRSTRILILDEPTSLLAPAEVERLLEVMKSLRREGQTLLFISHRLQEVFSIADRISVLHRGMLLETFVTRQTTIAKVTHAMIPAEGVEPAGPLWPSGWPLSPAAPWSVAGVPAPRLVVSRVAARPLRHESVLRNFDLPPLEGGETLGIGGIVGNGQRTLARLVAGVLPAEQGYIALDGVDITRASVGARRAQGLCWLPANPAEEALMVERPLWENLLLGKQRDRALQRAGWLRMKAIRRWAAQIVAAYDIQPANIDQRIAVLSGGNVQKVALAQTLTARPRLVILEQPGRGLDQRAQGRLHARVRALQQEGVAFLIFSHDLHELLSLCHRVAILFRGRLMGVLSAAEGSFETLARWMVGVDPEDAGNGA